MRDYNVELDFVGIGSGKSGSTWFFRNLVKHPSIFDGGPKEINYFSHLYDGQSASWYGGQFAGANEGQQIGEFSVTYMYHPEAARRIRKDFPRTKVIAILRNPVERTFSDFLHRIRKHDIPDDTRFWDFIRDEKNLLFGKYADALRPFYSEFPREQIKILILERFVADAAAGFREVYQFLGLEEFLPGERELAARENEARSYRILRLEQALVRSYRFLARAGFTRLTEAIVRSGVPEWIRKINQDSRALPSIDAESRRWLADYYACPNEELGRLIGECLPPWKQENPSLPEVSARGGTRAPGTAESGAEKCA